MRVSIVICAYNEEATIREVLESSRIHNPDHEIVVVDDGSTDNTPLIVEGSRATYSLVYERLPQNKGKSFAMVHGVEKSSGDIIVFFDADVSNVRAEHYQNLISPLIAGNVDMVLGQPTNTLIDYRVNPFKTLTGERAVFRKDIEPILPDIRDIKFGVETFINLYYQSQGKRIEIVLLDGLKHPTKYGKVLPFQATKEFLKEGQEIGLTLLQNQDLILKRLERKMKNTSADAANKIHELQASVNKKIEQVLKKMRT